MCTLKVEVRDCPEHCNFYRTNDLQMIPCRVWRYKVCRDTQNWTVSCKNTTNYMLQETGRVTTFFQAFLQL